MEVDRESDQFIALFGLNDENVKMLRDELGVEIFAHGQRNHHHRRGTEGELCRTVLERLQAVVERGESIGSLPHLRYAIELAAEGNADRIDEIMQGAIAITYRGAR
jgi:phosphate starvation-inducible protein PhoH